jgi:hypothetical protein
MNYRHKSVNARAQQAQDRDEEKSDHAANPRLTV